MGGMKISRDGNDDGRPMVKQENEGEVACRSVLVGGRRRRCSVCECESTERAGKRYGHCRCCFFSTDPPNFEWATGHCACGEQRISSDDSRGGVTTASHCHTSPRYASQCLSNPPGDVARQKSSQGQQGGDSMLCSYNLHPAALVWPEACIQPVLCSSQQPTTGRQGAST